MWNRHSAIQRLGGSIGGALAFCLLSGCVYVPGHSIVDLTKPDHAAALAAARAEAKSVAGKRDRQVGPIAGSLALVHAEMRHHLPPSKVPDSSRVTVKREGGRIFGGGRYVVTAVANFSPKQRSAFTDAARRLQGHLEAQPEIVLRLHRPTENGPVFEEEIWIR